MNKYNVGILGNMNESYEPHYAMNKCFSDLQENIGFSFEWVPTESLAGNAVDKLGAYQGLIAGSGPYKSKEGVINGIRYARKNNIPFLGTCSGFGYAVLEMGQSILKLDAVHHPGENAELPVAETFLQPLSICNVEMHTISFKPVSGTLTSSIYGGAKTISEESHCTYGINRKLIPLFENEGLIVSGCDDDGEPKIMEYNRNDFFIITLFLPQLKPGLHSPHPLFAAFFKSVEQSGAKHNKAMGI
ncbi:MAG: hypothetical protein ACHQIM_22420 [Sphingobacteriales bacterium]